jgi:hypothetical protein
VPTIRYYPGGDATVTPAGWTTHPMGAFRRQGDWFVDVTQGRAPRYPWAKAIRAGERLLRAKARTLKQGPWLAGVC